MMSLVVEVLGRGKNMHVCGVWYVQESRRAKTIETFPSSLESCNI